MHASLKQLTSLLIAVILAVVLVAGLILLLKDNDPVKASTDNVAIDTNGKQIVEIDAKGGYLPSLTEAKAGVPTIIRVTTKGTFDCSTSLTIPKLSIAKMLPPTGSTDIEIAAHSAGTVLNVTCSMGMYSFKIKFV